VEQVLLKLWKLRTTEHAALDQVSRFCTPLQVTAQTDGQKATFVSQGILAICVTNHIGRCQQEGLVLLECHIGARIARSFCCSREYSRENGSLYKCHCSESAAGKLMLKGVASGLASRLRLKFPSFYYCDEASVVASGLASRLRLKPRLTRLLAVNNNGSPST
jgi:hypothetical protein